jgi:hypothetical protein
MAARVEAQYEERWSRIDQSGRFKITLLDAPKSAT